MTTTLRYLPAALALATVSLFGQSAPHLSPHTFEVGGFVGSSYGLDEFRVMGGGNITYGINKYVLPYAEFSYFPGIPREQKGTFPTTGQQFRLQFAVPISDFHGGVHIRLPIRESRVVPYLVAGAGLLHTYKSSVTARFDVPVAGLQTQNLDIPSATDPAVNFGGGLRFYTTQRFGMRVEGKAYKPLGDFKGVFGKMEVGFFFQFR